MTPHSIYKSLGRSAELRQRAYRQLFRAQISRHDIETIRDATNKAWVLGNNRFKEKIERLSDRRTRPKPKGRPPKGLN